MFINDIEEGINRKISIFANDTKLCRVITSIQDLTALRGCGYSWGIGVDNWQMTFNVDKVMHFQY